MILILLGCTFSFGVAGALFGFFKSHHVQQMHGLAGHYIGEPILFGFLFGTFAACLGLLVEAALWITL